MIAEEEKRRDEFHFENGGGVYPGGVPRVFFVSVANTGLISTRVPIRLYWGYVVIVEGSIGNLHKLSFQVDTGAYSSVLDQKIAQRLGLQEQAGRVEPIEKKCGDAARSPAFLTSWPSSCRVSSCSGPRPLTLSEGPRPQGGRDCGSGCPAGSDVDLPCSVGMTR
jgi:hypothetical protein